MHRIDSSGATEDGFFKETPSPATKVSAAWGNDVQENIIGVIEGAGLELDKGNYSQLLDAIALLIGGGIQMQLGSPGWFKIQRPGDTEGLMVQWGEVTETVVSDGVFTPVDFPADFPTACDGVAFGIVNYSGNINRDSIVSVGAKSATGFTPRANTTTGASSIEGFFWWAWGH